MNTSGIPLMSDVLGLLQGSQKPEYCLRFLKVDTIMLPAALCSTFLFRRPPHDLTVRGIPLPVKEIEEYRVTGERRPSR